MMTVIDEFCIRQLTSKVHLFQISVISLLIQVSMATYQTYPRISPYNIIIDYFVYEDLSSFILIYDMCIYKYLYI